MAKATKIKISAAEKKTLESILSRTLYLANQMIYTANYRRQTEKGDPKIGGHSSASTSALHILGALHYFVKSGFDHISNKPHASPTDHSCNYLLDLFLKKDFSKLSLQEANTAMAGLRAFSQNGEPVFQSYHSIFDCDNHNFFPSGTVGIPPVQAGYLALAYRYAEQHGYNVPKDAHFWSLIGDSEFREGSLFEAIPDFSERQLGNLTWIVDYNRQSLDGHRIINHDIHHGTDAQRIERTMEANGWEVIQLQHGSKRLKLFNKPNGSLFKEWLENELTDYQLQVFLLLDPKDLKPAILNEYPKLKKFISGIKDPELHAAMRDLAGHDLQLVVDALQKSKENPDRPTMIVAHTVKGWGLEMAGVSGNHSSLPSEDEINLLQKNEGLKPEVLFGRFSKSSEEGKFLKERGASLLKDILSQNKLMEKNKSFFAKQFKSFPESLGINLKYASFPHTQWMLGQLTSKINRIANTPTNDKLLAEKQKPLSAEEKNWKTFSEMFVSMAPDVGTSTNLNPSMDGKVYGSEIVDDLESEYKVKDLKSPDLVPGEQNADRFLRFEIAEANVMSCMGSFGRMRDTLGIPLLPLMTVYDFFIKRAHDQYFYDLYWKSSFLLVGTPSGITLAPEGAQHGWKSDFQVPNQITWEPSYCQELDWIICDAVKRHCSYDNEGRNGVVVRGVTKGLDQKLWLKSFQKQLKFKSENPDLPLVAANQNNDNQSAITENSVPALPDVEILSQIRKDVLQGGYYLLNYEGYQDYRPGNNVVHIFTMGALVEEALKASDELLTKGIYANVIVVTSTDLLVGNLGHENNYSHLKLNLSITGQLHLNKYNNPQAQNAELVTLSGQRVPIISVHDGEPGLLDNIGSIVGTRHEALCVRKHSKCGTTRDIYKYHGLDAPSIIQSAENILEELALEPTLLPAQNLSHFNMGSATNHPENPNFKH